MLSLKQASSTRRRFWTPGRLAATVLVLSLGAALSVSSCNSTDEPAKADPVAKNAPNPGRNPASVTGLAALPANVLEAELKAASGAPIKLSSYTGKVLLVNLWATWCGPCRIETPELVKLHKHYQTQGVEMVGLSTENPDASEASVRNFVRDFEVDYRIGWATPDVAITLMQGRDAIPQSFVISRDGHIVRRFVGFNPTTTPPQLKQAIEEALNVKG